LPSGQLPPLLWRWPVGLMSLKKRKEKKKRKEVILVGVELAHLALY
jgi:hypothetical protein